MNRPLRAVRGTCFSPLRSTGAERAEGMKASALYSRRKDSAALRALPVSLAVSSVLRRVSTSDEVIFPSRLRCPSARSISVLLTVGPMELNSRWAAAITPRKAPSEVVATDAASFCDSWRA